MERHGFLYRGKAQGRGNMEENELAARALEGVREV